MTVKQSFEETMSEIRNINRRYGMNEPFAMASLEYHSIRAKNMYQKLLDNYVHGIEIDKKLGILSEEKIALYEKSAADMQRTIDQREWF